MTRIKPQYLGGMVFLATFGWATMLHAATLPARAPGLWQSSTFVTLANGTPLRGGNAIVTLSCVDADTDTRFFTFEGSSCSAIDITGTGASYQIASNCRQQGQPVKIRTRLTYTSSQTVELIGTVTTPSGLVHLNAELEYQGPCLAGMQPGDEGALQNGAFVKTDNINDPFNQ